ncbi:UDP-glucose 4-epimerase family protein [Paraburkholderia sabiae]|uniref:SDR family oxidoreductase n=1 Tax=Paraburkholderia sabiae TaxID=273251 RepID=A0ABU9QJY8_9BURK|nr:SDR family oxidoreductase [Paraburkholderia sabiae]WJZ73476.1 SDR family oxidoreductase [Paraburkholderia sabiae]CAD6542252.1 N-acetyl-alpha-D-glucosaminyl-diphospho-ditrans, octacis-undecaprenol 4-epimerase [Paraburkholderia sabiae]
MSHVVVSGANGFVGRALCRALLDAGHRVTGLVRRSGGCVDGVTEWIDSSTDYNGIAETWPAGLAADCIVHLAARVHVMHDTAADPDAAFRATNVDGTLRLAAVAQQHGVPRFLFVSSIKAVAETDNGRPLREYDAPRIDDAYGRSKRAAEEGLIRLGDATGLEIVIARPPLVYGPQVRANFLRLMDAVWRGVPLPLGGADARRSMIYVGNLADALAHCATDPRAVRQCFHVADSTAPTVAELVRALARHLGKPARLLPVPASWLRAAGRLTGRSAQVDRLIGGLQVDTSHIRDMLGWQPPYSTDEGLSATADWYRSTH